MITRRILIALSLLGLVAACGGPNQTAEVPEAEPAGASSAEIGDHVVHFSAQTTDQLPPEVARAYNIVRSPNRAMLNVSVLRAADNTPVEASVAVKTVNLTGQLKNVTMRQINEQDAHLTAAAMRLQDRLFQALAKQDAVWQAGEIVIPCGPDKLTLPLLA